MFTDREQDNAIVISEFTNESVLVLAPHSDDEVIGPGGTIRRHVLAGATVAVVVFTDGRWGGYDQDGSLVQRRKAESRAAAKIVGTQEPIFLDILDGSLDDDPAVVGKVREIIERMQPRFIYLPALTDEHPDHWAANRILLAALKSLDETMVRGITIRGYEIWSPLFANCYVEITSVIDLKTEAIAAFASQTSGIDYATAILSLNRYRALASLKGQGYAEAFMKMSFAEFERLCIAANPKQAAPNAKIS
jgi:LmbE family N-acetylglucosaminyl deacetylase